MTDPIRIANCSGFYGDRIAAAAEMVHGGPIDVLTGDWLAELTMLILARTQAKRPGGGYARTFLTQMEQVMGTCLDDGIKVVTNAGGLDPDGCADALAELADRLGLSPTIAYVNGDDLLPRLGELLEAGVHLDHFETGEPVGDVSRFITANAYLGCWGIVDALAAGADIVVTGRATDAAVVCGPAAWHHGWARDDWDALAGAVVAGHIIECGTQATGGNYSFFTEVEGLTHTGFPWAEIAADGSSVIGKHAGTGGAVTVGTVTSQLLYEIGSPAYLGPDVTARFDTVALEQVDVDRVRVSGVQGEPLPATLKVAMNELGGFRTDLNVALTGLDIEAKADLVEAAFWRAASVTPDEIESVTTRVVRTDKADPASNEEAVALWRITLKDHDERKVGKGLGGAINELALATIPGLFAVGGSSMAKPFGVYRPAVVPADLVPQHVVLLGGERTVVESVAPTPASPVVVLPAAVSLPAAPADATTRAPLGRVFGSRSGDKGGNANLGVFARSAEAYAWLDGFLTVERLRELLPETAELRVERFDLPNIWSLNFVLHGLLQEGVAASTRQDGQAKGLGEWLRARVVDLPVSLVEPQGVTDTVPASDLERRLRAIPAPRPMLSRDDLHRLTDRQREILRELGTLFRDGFADLTMSELAARLGCSLRTLYGLAPSRDELVLTVVDLHLWRIGRDAMAAIKADMAPLDAVRAYLSAATVAVSTTTEPYARDLEAMPAAQRRNANHGDYVVAVTRTLLDLAVERGDIADVDTAAVARVIANLGQDFIRADVLPTLRSSPKVAADAVVDIVLRGLARP